MKIGSIEITDDEMRFPVGTPLETALRIYVMATLLKCQGDKAKAAQQLEISIGELDLRLNGEVNSLSP